jgi:RNA polymerase sigma-70 factor (ECF subfamily)
LLEKLSKIFGIRGCYAVHRELLRIAQGVTHNREEAEEAVQEAFFKAYQRLDQFQESAKFSTWLIRIVLNEALVKLRKKRTAREESVRQWPAERRR